LEEAMTVGPGQALPLPPPEMRALVGPTEPEAFDNPSGALVFPSLPLTAYERVFDFGCGCGRIARQLIQQRPRPFQYLGIDLHAGMIAWCNARLAPHARRFRFRHHDVFNVGFNPTGKRGFAPFPVQPDERFTLVNAWSVFTHILEDDIEPYLGECARVLAPGGIFHSTWFLFEKSGFPMMQESQNALYINHIDPTNAVIVDVGWLESATARAGLTITSITPPVVRGFQWVLQMRLTSDGVPRAAWPADQAPTGIMRPPFSPADAHRIGLDERAP
jgi:SAM-dependent methyltransferase